MTEELRNKFSIFFAGIIFYVVPLIIVPFYEDTFYHFKIFTVYISCVLYLLFTFKKLKTIKIKLYLEDYFLLGFLVFIIFSSIFSVDIIYALYGEPFREEGLMALLCYVLIYFLISRTFEVSLKFIKYMQIVFIIVCIFGCIQYFFKDFNILYSAEKVIKQGAFSTIGNRNFASSYIIIILPLTICIYIYKGQKLALASSLIGFTALLCTFTRSGWLALSAQLVIILYFILLKYARNKHMVKRFSMVFIAFACITFTLNSYSKGEILGRYFTIGSEAINTLKDPKDSNGSTRIFIWKRAVKLVKDRPILGSGPDTFAIVFMDRFKDDAFRFYNTDSKGNLRKNTITMTVDKAHNEYIQIAVTMGIPALIFYLCFIVVICWKLLKVVKLNENLIPFLIAIIGYIIQAFFNISVVSVAPLFWGIIGISIAQQRLLISKQTQLDTNV